MKLELNYMRVFLCILIIITHILTQYTIQLEPDNNQLSTLYWIRNGIIIATPGFIILSVMLTTLNYADKLPARYLWQRVKYILIPYILIGSFYSYTASLESGWSFRDEFLSNVIRGEWHGYFILVIMQFIVLNVILYKINPKILSSKITLLVSFIITASYLYSYYHVDAVYNFVQNYYPLGDNTVILGWLFFYFFGSYIGSHYEKIKSVLITQSALIVLFLLISYGFFIALTDGDFWTVTSFHYSLLLLHTSGFLMLLYISIQLVGIQEQLVDLISKYSLFIFLFHPILLPLIYSFTDMFTDSTIIFILITLLFVLGSCIGIGMILSYFKIFRFVLGKQPFKE